MRKDLRNLNHDSELYRSREAVQRERVQSWVLLPFLRADTSLFILEVSLVHVGKVTEVEEPAQMHLKHVSLGCREAQLRLGGLSQRIPLAVTQR